MVTLLRNLFSCSLKTNNSLYFAVLTGCLRIAKESIFTGLNHLHVLSVTDVQYDEHFGFSNEEVVELLKYYHSENKYELIKEWYDGYHFGNADVYCPWDVINYCAKLRSEPAAFPEAFWVNSSGNDIIRSFLQKAAPGTRRQLEELMNGGSIAKKIDQELTYRDDTKLRQDGMTTILKYGIACGKKQCRVLLAL